MEVKGLSLFQPVNETPTIVVDCKVLTAAELERRTYEEYLEHTGASLVDFFRSLGLDCELAGGMHSIIVDIGGASSIPDEELKAKIKSQGIELIDDTIGEFMHVFPLIFP